MLPHLIFAYTIDLKASIFGTIMFHVDVRVSASHWVYWQCSETASIIMMDHRSSIRRLWDFLKYVQSGRAALHMPTWKNSKNKSFSARLTTFARRWIEHTISISSDKIIISFQLKNFHFCCLLKVLSNCKWNNLWANRMSRTAKNKSHPLHPA